MANINITFEITANNLAEYQQMINYFNINSGEFVSRQDFEELLKVNLTKLAEFNQW